MLSYIMRHEANHVGIPHPEDDFGKQNFQGCKTPSPKAVQLLT